MPCCLKKIYGCLSTPDGDNFSIFGDKQSTDLNASYIGTYFEDFHIYTYHLPESLFEIILALRYSKELNEECFQGG